MLPKKNPLQSSHLPSNNDNTKRETEYKERKWISFNGEIKKIWIFGIKMHALYKFSVRRKVFKLIRLKVIKEPLTTIFDFFSPFFVVVVSCIYLCIWVEAECESMRVCKSECSYEYMWMNMNQYGNMWMFSVLMQ